MPRAAALELWGLAEAMRHAVVSRSRAYRAWLQVVIEMSDLFAGRKKEAKGHGGHLHTPFKAAKEAAKEAAVRIDTINLVFPR